DLRDGSLVCLGLGSHCYLPQPSTVMPMERAVPAMIFDAASMSFAFRSACFVSAIWRICSCVIFATLTECGVDEPVCTPAAFLISSAAGGVFRMNVKLRSS